MNNTQNQMETSPKPRQLRQKTAKILAFPMVESARKASSMKRFRSSIPEAGAEILFFTGVRYERDFIPASQDLDLRKMA